jgi:hypothetical protein
MNLRSKKSNCSTLGSRILSSVNITILVHGMESKYNIKKDRVLTLLKPIMILSTLSTGCKEWNSIAIIHMENSVSNT